MDRAVLIEHLSQAERHVADGVRHVEQQRERVKELGRGGPDCRRAVSLLEQFEVLLAMHIQDRNNITAELAKSKPDEVTEPALTIVFELPPKAPHFIAPTSNH